MSKQNAIILGLISTVAAAGILTMAATVFALSQNITCADLPNGAAPCTGSTITFAAANQDKFNSGAGIQIAEGTTLYVSLEHVGTGDGEFFIAGNSVDGSTHGAISGSGSVVDFPVDVPTGNVWNTLYLRDLGSFSGTVSEICVTDTPGECGGTPPSPGTGSTTVMVVQNAAEQMFDAMILFLASMAFMVWLMRKK